MILFPVPDKTKIVNWFISQAKNLKMMQTNDIYNTCLDISNVLNAGDISNARSKVITLLHEINGTNNNSYMELVNHLIREVGLLPYIDTYTASWEDRFVCEVFKVNIGEKKTLCLTYCSITGIKEVIRREKRCGECSYKFW